MIYIYLPKMNNLTCMDVLKVFTRITHIIYNDDISVFTKNEKPYVHGCSKGIYQNNPHYI